MIRLLGKLDKTKRYWVGVSGGVDSMAAFHFLRQMKYHVSTHLLPSWDSSL